MIPTSGVYCGLKNVYLDMTNSIFIRSGEFLMTVSQYRGTSLVEESPYHVLENEIVVFY